MKVENQRRIYTLAPVLLHTHTLPRQRLLVLPVQTQTADILQKQEPFAIFTVTPSDLSGAMV